jgi:hypothetical protein
LDTAASIRAGGKRGPAVVANQRGESLLVAAVTGTAELSMPPAGEGSPLSSEQIALLKRWIDQGAAAPADEAPEADPRRHWAYQPPVRGEVPAVTDAAWVRNPVDAFIAAERERHGLTPAPEAPKHVLLRRVYLDLIGLTPSRDELDAFLADRSDSAYETVVERLLADPRYGERWGRHWMDVWRYSDWYGRRKVNNHRNSRRYIWRWRDWIVESLNADKGYDRMVTEMLAGDELAPGDDDVARATGLLGRNFYVFNRTVWVQDVVEYTAMGLLGITMRCARCHDHKFDPIAQEEYYRFRAFFEPHNARADRIPGKPTMITVGNVSGTGQIQILEEGFDRIYDADPTAVTHLFVRGNEASPNKDLEITPGVPAVLSTALPKITPIDLPRDVFYPDLRAFVREETLTAHRAAVTQAEANAEGNALASATLATARAKLAAIEARYEADEAKYAAPPDPRSAELSGIAAEAERQAALCEATQNVLSAEAGVAAAKKDQRAAAEKKLIDAQTQLKKLEAQAAAKVHTPIGEVFPQQSTGRRLALARWIADAKNPLTARVAVNHIWLRHFGSPLAANVRDFGLRAEPPTHPELLDWLAVEFTANGWSMKHLHRLLVTSNTYRQASIASPDEPGRKVDPANRYLWRMNTRRMESEVVRDSLWHLTGGLDFTQGGPDLDPASAGTSSRRSIYFRHTPDEKALLLTVFDAADPAECYRREESVVPHQALALANGPLSLGQARRVASEVSRNAGQGIGPKTDRRFVDLAFYHVLARPPTDAERQSCVAFLARQTSLLAEPTELTAHAGQDDKTSQPADDPHQRAREGLIHVLFNHHDFVTIH